MHSTVGVTVPVACDARVALQRPGPTLAQHRLHDEAPAAPPAAPPAFTANVMSGSKIRSAAETDSRATKAGLTDRTVEHDGQSVTTPRRRTAALRVPPRPTATRWRCRRRLRPRFFRELDGGLAILRVHLVEQPARALEQLLRLGIALPPRWSGPDPSPRSRNAFGRCAARTASSRSAGVSHSSSGTRRATHRAPECGAARPRSLRRSACAVALAMVMLLRSPVRFSSAVTSRMPSRSRRMRQRISFGLLGRRQALDPEVAHQDVSQRILVVSLIHLDVDLRLIRDSRRVSFGARQRQRRVARE